MKTKSFVLRKLQIQSPHIRRVFFTLKKNLCNEKNSLISNMISDSMSLYYIKSKWQRCAQRVFQVCQKKIGRHTQEKGLHLHFTLFVVVVVGFKTLLLKFSYASCSSSYEYNFRCICTLLYWPGLLVQIFSVLLPSKQK